MSLNASAYIVYGVVPGEEFKSPWKDEEIELEEWWAISQKGFSESKHLAEGYKYLSEFLTVNRCPAGEQYGGDNTGRGYEFPIIGIDVYQAQDHDCNAFTLENLSIPDDKKAALKVFLESIGIKDEPEYLLFSNYR